MQGEAAQSPAFSACEAQAGQAPAQCLSKRGGHAQAWALSGVWGQKGEWAASAIQEPVIYQDTNPTHTDAETLNPL